MQFLYKANLIEEEEGGYTITFNAVPEAITYGADLAAALHEAIDALDVALLYYLEADKHLPESDADQAADGDHLVAPSAQCAAKLAVFAAWKASGISKSELARRLDVAEGEARRILDPDHATKLATLEAALAVLGRRLVVSSLAA